MEYMELEVYSQSINRGVVKMPSQGFPGLVVQGETLATLLKLARSVHEKSQATSNAELTADAFALQDNLEKLVAHFESTLGRHKIPMPYSTVPAKPIEK
jgi:hypothetical protein